MLRNKKTHNPFVIFFGIVLLFGIIMPAQVKAQGIDRGDNLPAGVKLAGDAVFHGSSVRVDGDVDGDVFAIANEVEINGSVNGSLFVLGNIVKVNGAIGGTVYSAALEFELAPNATLSRNLYFVGLSLTTQEGAQIRRNLFSAVMGAQLRGLVDGEIRAIIGPLEFFRWFMQKIDHTDWFKSHVSPELGFVNLVSNPVAITNEPEVLYASLAPFLSRETISNEQIAQIDWGKVGDWLLKRFREWVVLLVFGLLCLWLKPEWIRGSAQLLQTRLLPATGWGLLGVVISFNLIGVVILLLVLITVISIFLGMVKLWPLAWSFMAVGGFSLGLISTAFALFVFYISKAIVAFLFGGMILTRIAPQYTRYNPLAMIIGLVFYVLLAAIPILGWVIGILVTVLGLGAAWLFFRDQRTLRHA